MVWLFARIDAHIHPCSTGLRRLDIPSALHVHIYPLSPTLLVLVIVSRRSKPVLILGHILSEADAVCEGGGAWSA